MRKTAGVCLSLTAFVALAMGLATAQTAAQTATPNQTAAQNKNLQITNGPVVENVTGNSATIAWSTNVPGSTVLKYGTDRNNMNQSAQVPWGGITHRVTLKNLQPNTTYFFNVESGQGQGTGTGAISAISQLTTKAAGATTAAATPAGQPQPAAQPAAGSTPAPAYNAATFAVMAGPIPQQITDTSAKLWWATNQQITGSVVKYGTSPSALTQQVATTQSSDQTSHTATLSGLQPNTDYYFQVVRLDGKLSTTGNFKTMPTGYKADQTVDITNGPVVEYLGDNQAIVSWSTSAPSSSVVKYGTTPSALNQTAQAPWTSGTHRVTISNLQPNTKYYFQIQSAQAKGTNTAVSSGVFGFLTTANAQSAMKMAQP